MLHSFYREDHRLSSHLILASFCLFFPSDCDYKRCYASRSHAQRRRPPALLELLLHVDVLGGVRRVDERDADAHQALVVVVPDVADDGHELLVHHAVGEPDGVGRGPVAVGGHDVGQLGGDGLVNKVMLLRVHLGQSQILAS